MTESVTAADLAYAVGAMASALRTVEERDWQVPAGDLDWTCWETIEHVGDDLFSYACQLGPKPPPLEHYLPFATRERRPGGPDETIYAAADAGTGGLIQIVEATGALLVAMVETSPAQVRAYHSYGISDPAGFAAMGVVEVLVHMYDVAAALHIEWTPPDDLCARVLARLFPDAPADSDRWATLLWATGRRELPGHPRRTSWRWDSTPR
jgi:hypothetical protein